MNDIGTIVGVIVGVFSIIAVIGGIIGRDRHTQTQIRNVEANAGKKVSEAVKDLHGRIEKVKDEYVRRDDLGTHMDHLSKGLSDLKDELKRTNQRLDKLLNPPNA